MARQGHRVEKLEDVLFAGLTPASRVCEVLKAAAEGNKDLSYRIAEMCPHQTWSVCDPAYTDRLEDAHAVCKAAAATFDKYAFASRQIEGLKGFLVPMVAGFIASWGHTLAVSAVLEGEHGDEDAIWAKVDEAEKKARADGAGTLARILDDWRNGLHEWVRAEWAGFDAFCRSELHLDARTLLKGFDMPAELTAWVEGILAEPPPEVQPEGTDKYLADLTGEIEATWRTVFLMRQGKQEAASTPGKAL